MPNRIFAWVKLERACAISQYAPQSINHLHGPNQLPGGWEMQPKSYALNKRPSTDWTKLNHINEDNLP